MQAFHALGRPTQRQRRAVIRSGFLGILFGFILVSTGALTLTHYLQASQNLAPRWDWVTRPLRSHLAQYPALSATLKSNDYAMEKYGGLYTRNLTVFDDAEHIMLMILRDNTFGFGAAAVIGFILRISTRILVVGRIRWDDMYITAITVIYLIAIGFLNIFPITNWTSPSQSSRILSDPIELRARTEGSIANIAIEQMMLACLWASKACIWLFIHRVCPRPQMQSCQIILRILAGYILFTYLALQALFFSLCRPLSQYYAIPISDPQCASYEHYSTTLAILDITSNLFLLLISAKLIWTAKLAPNRIMFLAIPFILGICTLPCAAMNKISRLVFPYTTTYRLWYIIQGSITTWIINILYIWPLLQKLCPLGPFHAEYHDVDGSISQVQRNNSVHTSTTTQTQPTHRWRGAFGRFFGVRRADRNPVVGTVGDVELRDLEQGERAVTGGAGGVGAVGHRRQNTGGTILSIMRDGGGEDLKPSLTYRDLHNLG